MYNIESLENIRDIFSILHDGFITDHYGNHNLLVLTVDCKFLADQINESFEKFYVHLLEINNLFLVTWPNDFYLPIQKLNEPKDIFKAKLEILSSEIRDYKVIVECNQPDLNFDYCGGNLIIDCRKIEIYDQANNQITIDKLEKIFKDYRSHESKK